MIYPFCCMNKSKAIEMMDKEIQDFVPKDIQDFEILEKLKHQRQHLL